jgi:hypothetical protein
MFDNNMEDILGCYHNNKLLYYVIIQKIERIFMGAFHRIIFNMYYFALEEILTPKL